MGRALRISFLTAALAGSVVYLLWEPEEPIDIEARWNRLAAPASEGHCPVPGQVDADWSIRMPAGEGGFEGLQGHVNRSVHDACDGDCPTRVQAVVEPVWGERPGFFTGFGSAQVHVAVDWRRPGCEGRSVWRLDLTVDQGRRGREDVVTRQLGRFVGDFLARSLWSRPPDTL